MGDLPRTFKKKLKIVMLAKPDLGRARPAGIPAMVAAHLAPGVARKMVVLSQQARAILPAFPSLEPFQSGLYHLNSNTLLMFWRPSF